MFLDADVPPRALLPGSNVSGSRPGADMSRHETNHTHTHTHSQSHPLFVTGQNVFVPLDVLH